MANNISWSIKTKKISLKNAIEFSKKKWEYIAKNDGSEKGLDTAIPEIRNFVGSCGLCQYMRVFDSSIHRCITEEVKCPAAYYIKEHDEYITCSEKGHYWADWFENKTSENAQKIFDFVVYIEKHQDEDN